MGCARRWRPERHAGRPPLWLEGLPSSSYPACIAVKAAADQGLIQPYLRRLREGFMCRRRKLDTTEALVEEARAIPTLNLDRFRIDLASHGTLEAFAEDLQHFGSMATAEVAAVCDLPGPRAPAELWRLAGEWRVKPERVLGGELWTLAQ